MAELSCTDAAEAFLERLGDDPLKAWACVEPDLLLTQARSLDAVPQADRVGMPLFGVPVGIKDNFDTADLPTTYGSPIYAGHRPDADAAVVARLRAAGALIAGKTACAEFAWMTPPETRNPLDVERTPGGSSNGSAAAVAAGHVPLASGSQTAGSVNRPASYCGVLGYTPTFGRFDRRGVKLMSSSLDNVGLFARSVADLRLASGVMEVRAGVAHAAAEPPRLGWAPTPLWASVEPDAADAIERWLEQIDVSLVDVGLPGYERIAAAQQTIQFYESARSLAPELRDSPDSLSPELLAALTSGTAMGDDKHAAALRDAAELGPVLIDMLRPYDAVLTPSTLGVPPPGLSFTGDPQFSRVWTLLHAPAVSLPLAWTDARLPAGLQLVAPPGRDQALLDAAEWLLGVSIGP